MQTDVRPANGISVKTAIAVPRCRASQMSARIALQKGKPNVEGCHQSGMKAGDAPRVRQRSCGKEATEKPEDQERCSIVRQGTAHLESLRAG